MACYVHNSLKMKILANSPNAFSNSPEYLLIEIICANSEKLLFASIYRRPGGLMFDDFIEAFTNHSHAYQNIILAGDLNCDLSSINYHSTYLRDLVLMLSLHIVESEPTHHTSNSDSCLDVFILDSPDKLHSLKKSEAPFIAGHDLLELCYTFDAPPTANRTVTRRSYRDFDTVSFCSTITSAIRDSRLLSSCLNPDIPLLDLSIDVNLINQEITDILLSALDTYAPIKTFTVNRPPAPWLSKPLKDRITTRNSLYTQSKRSGLLLDLQIYRRYRDDLKADLTQARNSYYRERLANIKDSNKLWLELANLGLAKSMSPSPLHFFTPCELISFYSSVSNLQPPCLPDEYRTVLSTVVRGHPSFSFAEITPNQIHELVSSIPSAKSYSTGHDHIPLFAIKESLQTICPILAVLFNTSLFSSTYPSSWGKALIRALSKISTPLTPSDTRPIANLCEPSKIEERLIHKQIIHWAEQNNIFDPRQSGFRANHSTQYALLRIVDDIKRNIDERRITILILFDFSKAFDTVPHLRLLIKLKELGFDDTVLDFFFSYLTDRSQAILDEQGNISDWHPTSSGVPQGSVLGPLLFSLYVNDIRSVLRHSQHMIFADDTQIYLSCLPSKLHQAINLISEDVQAVADFASTNGLKLNLSKSKILILGSDAYTRQIDHTTLPVISVNDVAIPYALNARNLGVTFTNNLSWKQHVHHISQKVHFTLHKLKFHRNSLSRELRASLISTLVFPIVDYCCLVYHGLSDELNVKLQRLINCCIRFIFDLRRGEHISPYRRQLGWLTVKSRRLYFLGIIMFKVFRYETPIYILDLFPRPEHMNERTNRRPAPDFTIPNHRTTIYHNSFSLSGMYLWESLPTSVKNSPSISVFKTRLYAYLLDLENNVI